MSQAPFPGHGQHGEEPLPGSGTENGTSDAGETRDAARDLPGTSGAFGAASAQDTNRAPDTNATRNTGGTPNANEISHAGRESWGADDDFDLDASLDRLVAEADAGRIQIPDPDAWQGLTISLADVSDPATASLAGFAQAGPADTMAPSAVLTALAETACEDLEHLSDNEVLGLASAGKRIASLGTWIEMAAAGEFAGRRVSGDKPGTVAGENLTEFAGDELAPELGMTPFAAAQHLGYARDVTRRLPATFAALHAGVIDGYRVKIIAEATQWLSDEHAAEADQVLAVSAAQLTYGRLRNAAARLVLMLDPEAAARRKDAAAGNARVTCFREEAGTAGLSGRDLPPAGTLASWAHVKARAAAYRAAGMAGTITELRARAFLDLLQEHDSRDALDLGTADGGTGPDDGTGPDGDATDGDGETAENGGPDGGGTDPRPGPRSSAGPGGAARTPPAALINITVPHTALDGADGIPGEVSGFGLMDAASIRDLAATASRNPATRWCVTVTGPDGTATAHGCVSGQHRYDPNHYRAGGSGGDRDGPAPDRDRPARIRDQPAHNRDGPAENPTAPARNRDGPPEAGQTKQTEQAADFLRRLKVQLAPIATGTCDHTSYEPRYRPSRKLKHLIRARTARCYFPGCSQHAADCDADHTMPWPTGPTCQCNLGPPCRHHHKCKQDPGWRLEQPEPGVMVWTGPSGRQYVTRPTGDRT